MDVEQRLAQQALFKLSVDTDFEFIKDRTDKGPLFYVMVLARRDAIEALGAIVHIDPAKTEDVRKLQNEVQRFLDMVSYVARILRSGDEAAQQLNAEEQDELRDIVAAEGGDIPGADE